MTDGRASLGSETIDTIYVSPIGGGADDWPTIMGLANEFAGRKKIFLGPGTYTCNTPNIEMESGLMMEMSPDTIINCTIPTSGVGSGYPFTIDHFNDSVLQNAGNVLSALGVVGSKSVTVTAATGLAIGDSIVLHSLDFGFVHGLIIDDISGTTVTFDEPLLMPFPIGSQLKKMSQAIVQDIHINGNGALITGTAAAAIEIFCARHIMIENLKIDGRWGLWAANYDYGCHDVHFKNCSAEFDTEGQWGFGLEISRNSTISGCKTIGAFTTAGFSVDSVQGCTLSNNLATNGVRGFIAVSIASAYSWSNHNLLFSQCYSANMTSPGFQITDGGSGITLEECHSVNCVDAFLSNVNNATTYAKGITFIGGRFVGTTAGIKINGGTGITIHGTDVSGSGIGLFCTGAHETIGVSAFGMIANDCADAVAASDSDVKDLLLVGVQARRSTDWGMVLSGASTKLIGCDLTDCGATTTLKGQIYIAGGTGKTEIYNSKFGFSSDPGAIVSYTIRTDVGATIIIDNCESILPNSTAATVLNLFMNNASSTLRVSNYRVVNSGGAGGGSRSGLVTNAACTVYKGANVDLSACETPYNYATAPKKNYGTFTANGTTEVDVINAVYPSPDSCVAFSLATAGGTVGHTPYISTKLATTTFKVKADALDTSVYNWQAL